IWLCPLQRCGVMGAYRALSVPDGEYRMAGPSRPRGRAFRYGAPTALPCPNGIHIWGHAAPAVSKGVHLRLPRPEIPQATACWHQALDVARHQQAKLPDLRAAMSLSRLWQQQGQQDAGALIALDLGMAVYALVHVHEGGVPRLAPSRAYVV